ncbi:TspO/MBR family protein [Aerosakkonema funiforme]|uniref:TspO/MBR family protein n=1 Tax=Aerosakkonema funiforme TaxID=1246630 RepID=UPI0035B927A0
MIKSWMVIAAVGLLIAVGSNLFTPSDVKWFKRLQRPQWLTFEFAIPLIWTFIFICGGWSAYIVWEKDPGTARTWWLMAFYILVEIAIVAYTPVMFRLRSLKVGTIIGAIGSILGVILAITVWTVSGWAALLLLPYAIWSPIGTYTTWEMIHLNPQDE